MGDELCRCIAAATQLRKKDFQPPDKVPQTYNQQTFQLDGMMDLELTFNDKVMKTTLYLKMDASDQLPLSEGVCPQLGII